MSVAGARLLSNGQVCLVGIGNPGEAACLVKCMYAPDLVPAYESDCIAIGFVSTAQIDRCANLISTVVGAFEALKVRLPTADGAPEIVCQTLKHFPTVIRLRPNGI